MAAVTHAQLAVDAGRLHFEVQFHRQAHEGVVVSAVQEPRDGFKLADGLFVGIVHKIQGRMFPYGQVRDDKFAAGFVRSAYFTVLVVQPGAHAIGAGEHVGVALGIHDGTAAAHGKAHDGALPFAAAATEFLFGRREELLEEEVLVGPVLYIEIAVLIAVDIVVSRIGHDDDGRNQFSAGNEFVGHALGMAGVYPVGVVSVEAVQQVDDGVVLRGLVAGGEIHIVLLLTSQLLAGDGLSDNLGGLGRCCERERQCQQGED